MNQPKELILTETFEDLRSELGDNLVKMMDFFVPLDDVEKDISLIAKSIKTSGKMVMLYGLPGSGKSTFIQSLQWRKHMPIRDIHNIDTTMFNPEESKLPQLLQGIRNIIQNKNVKPTDTGVFLIVIDYLETLSDEEASNIKAFFRSLNGILRQNPIMIIWPITELEDRDSMRKYAKAVSGTLFYRTKDTIHFLGPAKNDFTKIVKNTISVLNNGYTYNDFQLLDEDFEEILSKLIDKYGEKFTLRDYLLDMKECWSEKTGQLEKVLAKIPKATEIWFLFCMPEAEDLVSQFVRKSFNSVDDCWDAYHSKLSEYIYNNQRAAYWTARRLQLAISGSFKTKILYIPTNALVSCMASYGKEFGIDDKINWDKVNVPKDWRKPSTAKKRLETSPLIRQIKKEQVQLGKRRGTSKPIEKAKKAFVEINSICSNQIPGMPGSDEPFNRALAKALSEIFPQYEIEAEKPHPWLPNIIPDIRIDQENKYICIELCYTKKSVPNAISDYVLKKLDNYMRQIESII